MRYWDDIELPDEDGWPGTILPSPIATLMPLLSPTSSATRSGCSSSVRQEKRAHIYVPFFFGYCVFAANTSWPQSRLSVA